MDLTDIKEELGSLILDEVESIATSDAEDFEPARKRRRKTVVSFVRPGQRVYPQSAYVGSSAWERAQTGKPEREVLSSFLADEVNEYDDQDGEYYTCYVLNDFVVYRTPVIKPLKRLGAENEQAANFDRGVKGQGELEIPSAVHVARGLHSLMFDGVLSSGDKEEVLHRIPFTSLSIGNLATPSEHNLNNSIWIQSIQGAKAVGRDGVWYEFGRPAAEYEKYWEAFEWLALFVKYVSDALEVCVQRKEKVKLSYFQKDFAAEMKHLHGGDAVFEKWKSGYGKDDFRIPLVTHVQFIWMQLYTADSKGHSLRKHLKQPLWGEILPSSLTAVPPAHPMNGPRDRCVVTAYVGNLFEWIFGQGVEVIEPDSANDLCDYDDDEDKIDEDDMVHGNDFKGIKQLILESKETKVLSDPKFYAFHHEEYGKAVYPRYTTSTRGPVQAGDVVELERGEDSRWKNSTKRWYAFVRDRWSTPNGTVKLRILWLYWPEDIALCMSMKYPYENELFFSDHCECDHTIRVEEVVQKVAVEFFSIDAKPQDSNAEFFVRQKYTSISDNIHIASLSPSDVSSETPCPCQRGLNLPIFQSGDFVLVKEKDRLQPYQFLSYEENRAWLRKLPRRREVEGEGKVNELIWTSEKVDVWVQKVIRKCHVTKVLEGQEVPPLANWSGSCDWFFYREGRSDLARAGLVDELPIPKMKEEISNASAATASPEGFRSTPLDQTLEDREIPAIEIDTREASPESNSERKSAEQKLRGLDLFCGGGNFGRGVADGGVVRHEWAVDIDINAIHTYKANVEHDGVNLYFGSINNFLFDIITGRARRLPRQGDIDFILAGSPCQGFSQANRTGHETLKSLSNSALVCTTLSAIDYYRPKYAILENVPSMAATRKYRGQNVNVSNQIMCALIGMGYQCRCVLLDAWNFGAPQSRTRLFIEIAAPGCALPEIPYGSHAHLGNIKSRAVGKTAANIKFAERDLDVLTAFPPIKVEDAWADLPSIGNGHLGVCIPYPEHKTYWTVNARIRSIMARIPRSESFGQSRQTRHPGYTEALRRGLIPEHLKLKEVPSRIHDQRFVRVAANGLAPTITCYMIPQSVVSGRVLHYCEDRAFTNLEAKRVQGFLDTDVLVGNASKVYRIIGNSVCRQVAFALGGKLAEAVMKGPEGSGNGVVPTDVAVVPMKSRKDNGHGVHSASKPSNVMVLIKKKPENIPQPRTRTKKDYNRNIPRDSVRVNVRVEGRIERLEVAVTSTPRKRIRIEVDNDAGEE